ncbi:class I SAM-dependent methyltransferase [Chitinimonas viridis]|uniref:Class I SAM-dependent methyltransferase n=1 Tax=Chitinimonas viridis TaxID=664880 RepID=A0ABT8B058_9NEIS|nr:class I SAM-dependent methyltransferase [Chitinimonas viridis]MDN3575400.1 class I SAM-dependent methyltransferase [Chitinimonas viridis]
MNTPSEQGVRYDARHAAAYDRKIRQLIPGYEALHMLSAHVLAEQLPAQAHILVSGSGSGEEILRYAQMRADWLIDGLDPSEEMHAVALTKCRDAGIAQRIKLLQGRPDSMALAEGYDAVTSLLVMHFLPDDGSKDRYLHALAMALRPGGVLLLADWVGQRGEAECEAMFRVWRRQQDATRDRPDQVALDFSHLDQHVYPVSAQRRATLLAQAGLTAGACYWQALGLSAIVAYKRA